MSGIATKPRTVQRTKPLRIKYPCVLEHKITAKLPWPEKWTIEKETHALSNQYVAFEHRIQYTNSMLHLFWRYHAKRDRVRVEDIPAHLSLLEDISSKIVSFDVRFPFDSIGTNVTETYENEIVTGATVAVNLFFMMLVAGGCAVIYHLRITKASPMPPPLWHHSEKKPPRGIRGWLILPAIHILLAPVGYLILLMRQIKEYSWEMWQQVAVPGAVYYDPWWIPWILYKNFYYSGIFCFHHYDRNFIFSRSDVCCPFCSQHI